eukprot:scaffold114505_cov26-Tisochrysis_lutea.AAC.5
MSSPFPLLSLLFPPLSFTYNGGFVLGDERVAASCKGVKAELKSESPYFKLRAKIASARTQQATRSPCLAMGHGGPVISDPVIDSNIV